MKNKPSPSSVRLGLSYVEIEHSPSPSPLTFTCRHCGHDWLPRNLEVPDQCPRCRRERPTNLMGGGIVSTRPGGEAFVKIVDDPTRPGAIPIWRDHALDEP